MFWIYVIFVFFVIFIYKFITLPSILHARCLISVIVCVC